MALMLLTLEVGATGVGVVGDSNNQSGNTQELESTLGDNPLVSTISKSMEPDVKKNFNECMAKEGNAGQNSNQEPVYEKCRKEAEKHASQTGAPAMAVAIAKQGDNEISSEVETVLEQIRSNPQNAIVMRVYTALEKLNCMYYYENISGNEDAGRYLKRDFYDEISNPQLTDPKMISSVNECAQFFASDYMEAQEINFKDPQKICNEILKHSDNIDHFRQYVTTPNQTGSVCTQSRGMSATGAQQAGATAQSGSGGVRGECRQAHSNVKKLFALGGENSLMEKYVSERLAGCISLNALSLRVKENDKDISQGIMSYASIDSNAETGKGIVCVAKNRALANPPYAVDFAGCVRAVQWYNGFALSNDLVLPVVGSGYEAVKGADIQSDAMKDSAKGGVDSQTAGFKAQKRIYKEKANVETAKAAMETARAVAMFANMASFPSPKVVSEEWCVKGKENSYKLEKEFSCSLVRMYELNRGEMEQALFPNQHVKDKLLQTGALALSKAIVAAITASIYRKQSKMVGKVEEALKEAEFNQPEAAAGLDLGPAFCDQNPGSPSCGGSAAGRINAGGVDIGFAGGGMQGNGNIGLESGELDSSTGSGNSAIADGAPQKEALNNILGSSDGSKSTNGFKKVAAAKVGGSRSGAGGGGGGGGGALGGGGAGGGDDSTGGAGGPRGPASMDGDKVKATFQKGGNNIRSGGTIGQRKKTDNPFASLGRKRGPSGKGVTIDDKNLHPKKVGLFETISKRYAKVAADKRIAIK